MQQVDVYLVVVLPLACGGQHSYPTMRCWYITGSPPLSVVIQLITRIHATKQVKIVCGILPVGCTWGASTCNWLWNHIIVIVVDAFFSRHHLSLQIDIIGNNWPNKLSIQPKKWTPKGITPLSANIQNMDSPHLKGIVFGDTPLLIPTTPQILWRRHIRWTDKLVGWSRFWEHLFTYILKSLTLGGEILGNIKQIIN